ncbi:hypothetical protein NPIL_221361 [Nephila pilipes]|uniref:Uncharacterized protein n=1 Tax=Nephila pilipes TaxID=299642 RepID=A0A8X6UPW5_NEPPI|nr:hypothetical protein NPIL_221361 [Nephila pilipes]
MTTFSRRNTAGKNSDQGRTHVNKKKKEERKEKEATKHNDITIAIKLKHYTKGRILQSARDITLRHSHQANPTIPLSKNYHRIKVASADGRNVPLSFPSVRLTMPKGGGHKKIEGRG